MRFVQGAAFMTALLGAPALASEPIAGLPSQEQFYSIEDNRLRFEAARDEGRLRQAREAMGAACEQENARAGGDEVDCGCVAEEFAKVSDETLYYEMILSYLRFQVLTEAKQAGDEDRLRMLRKLGREQKLTTDLIQERCRAG